MSTIDTIRRRGGSEIHKASTGNRGLVRTISALSAWYGNAMVKRRTRLHLSELSDELLKDVGIAPADARREFGRPFWD
ncbi:MULTISPECIES: DUF1127 domain-containing protein [Phyllobacterium]|jgi:uncharacterized protein YjiS (DUF1127 family)|uniref:YjiS-like domain-containing protein n=1 Tax=Phyllobacterium sophorae TaxID=1520277 RepID=A0A2P7BI96_9HYPH|nr:MULTISPECIES: DUF1127 domain-containing protein [Phyllobacterium]PSH66128.1 hypothetical protein CU103_05905 [Phyllobacterium sophorae]UXN64307.1 DUF1127 domain-containing protein [Phyllobacterium sp. A18/5-2]